IPAPAQGVLAIQIRESDKELYDALQVIHSSKTAEEIAVERKVLNRFEGGCHLPLGCYCRKENEKFQVWTAKADQGNEFPDRLFMESETTEGLAEHILAKFAPERKLPKSVFITRQLPESSYFRRALEKNNIEIEDRSLIRTVPVITKFDSYILKNVDWVFFNSKNAIEYFFQLEPQFTKKTKFGVVGRGSEEMLRRYGRLPDFTGEDEGIETED